MDEKQRLVVLMKRILTSVLILAAAGIAGACGDEANRAGDILGVAPGDQPFRVRIAGPLIIQEGGTYSWHAQLDGNAGGADFVWEVLRRDAPDEMRRHIVAAPILETWIDVSEWTSFEIVLTARSGAHEATDRTLITVCPRAGLVDKCTARKVLAERS